MQDMITIQRQLPLGPMQAWDWLTDSARTALWYGPFRLEGDRLFVRLMHEEGQPEAEGRLLSMIPGRELRLQLGWEVTLTLDEIPGGSLIRLRQAKTGTADDPWIEAGWSFYLDCLLAAIRGDKAPDFKDYHPKEG